MFIIFVHIRFKFLKELYDYLHKHPTCIFHISENKISHLSDDCLQRSIKVLYSDHMNSKEQAEKFCNELYYTGFANYVKTNSIIEGVNDRIEMVSIIN